MFVNKDYIVNFKSVFMNRRQIRLTARLQFDPAATDPVKKVMKEARVRIAVDGRERGGGEGS